MLQTHSEEKRVRVRQMRSARRLGQDEQYLTVREILSEASTVVPPQAGLSRARSDFCRFGFATLGYTLELLKGGSVTHLPAMLRPSRGYIFCCQPALTAVL